MVYINWVFVCSATSSPKFSEDSVPLNTTNSSHVNNEANSSARVDVIPKIVEPVDYENYHKHHNVSGNNSIENDDLLVEFPDGSDDVDVYVLSRKVRTLIPPGPEEDM